ncbi:MAG TPA: sigma-54-dependent Fis family transcriptional regulator, partial [Ignavibacteria bacterium]|nr:sigma-54-dependent Fis family transcriptional regulator [Ignavibacteria bacterium]
NVEITAIKNALEEASDNKNKAADILGIPISTLRSKMEKYDLF